MKNLGLVLTAVLLFVFLPATAADGANGPMVTEVLNAAGLLPAGLPGSGIAQGSMFAVKGSNLGPEDLVGPVAPPLQTELSDTSIQVTVGDVIVDAFMVYSWTNQLAAILPSSTPLGTGTLTVTYDDETSAPAPIEVVPQTVGIFTRNTAGYGPAIVQNWISATEIPHLNAFTDAAKPGQIAVLWATGLGAIFGDDAGPPPVGDLDVDVDLLVGGKSAKVLYKGRSYSFPGIDQINFEVPAGVEGCYVPVAVKVGGIIGNYATMAVAPNGGVCSSPTSFLASDLQYAAQGQDTRVGMAGLVRVDVSAPGMPLQFTFGFAGAGFLRLEPLALLSSLGPLGGNLEVPPVEPGTCTVHKTRGSGMGINDIAATTGLDAGPALDLTGPLTVQIPPEDESVGMYGLDLEEEGDQIAPGQYTLNNGAGGAGVGSFQAALTIPTSQLNWTNKSSITSVNRNQNLTVTWSGGDPSKEVVAIVGFSADTDREVASTFVCVANPGAGSFTVPAEILGGLPVSSEWQDLEEEPPFGLILAAISRLDQNRFPAPGLDAGLFYYVLANQWLVPFE